MEICIYNFYKTVPGDILLGLVCREASDIWPPEGHVSRSGKSIPGRGGEKEEKKKEKTQ